MIYIQLIFNKNDDKLCFCCGCCNKICIGIFDIFNPDDEWNYDTIINIFKVFLKQILYKNKIKENFFENIISKDDFKIDFQEDISLKNFSYEYNSLKYYETGDYWYSHYDGEDLDEVYVTTDNISEANAEIDLEIKKILNKRNKRIEKLEKIHSKLNKIKIKTINKIK